MKCTLHTVLIFISTWVIGFICTTSVSAQDCHSVYKDIPIEELSASAGFFSNLLKRSGSVSYESERIFTEARGSLHNLQSPPLSCPSHCQRGSIPSLYFFSTPELNLADYEDQKHCRNLRRETSLTPLVYRSDVITTISDLMSWIGDLSQGKGSDGEDLYRRCDKSCSPNYQYQITKLKSEADVYSVKATIICGEARDKDHDRYKLRSYFRWSCQDNASLPSEVSND